MYSENRRNSSVLPDQEFPSPEVPAGVDRRIFMMRSAVIGAATVMTGRTLSAQQQTAAASAPPPQVTTKPGAMALTAREMNSKYKETSEGGLAVSVTLC